MTMETFSLPDEERRALSDLLIKVSETLLAFDGDMMMAGYGVEARLDSPDGKARFRMHPFCWCDRKDCPWCNTELSLEEGYSNHEILQLEPVFEREGFVPGQGAPNFHFDDGEARIRVWWYKYIGRSMHTDRNLDMEDLTGLRARIERHLEEHKISVLKNSLASALDPQITKLSPELSGILRNSLLSTIISAPDANAQARATEEVKEAVRQLTRHASLSSQAIQAGQLLDEAGVARFENPDDPEDLRLEFSLGYRVECLVKGVPPRGEEIPF